MFIYVCAVIISETFISRLNISNDVKLCAVAKHILNTFYAVWKPLGEVSKSR